MNLSETTEAIRAARLGLATLIVGIDATCGRPMHKTHDQWQHDDDDTPRCDPDEEYPW